MTSPQAFHAAWDPIDSDRHPALEAEFDPEPQPQLDDSGYTSPLMSRLTGTRLTVALLQEEIPRVRAGEEAQARLDRATKRMGDKTRHELTQTVRQGELAKERLFIAALPLIRTIAHREWRRRQQWGSQVPLEDLTQEAIMGFLKGIAGFKTEAIGKSATNYLGQWMLVETRRAAEVLDHDLQVGHDAGERFRRVRALRARLATELGREPTDDEIAAASRNAEYVTRPGLVGKAPKEGETVAVGKGLTSQQVAEERMMRTRVGHSARFAATEDSEEPVGMGYVDPSRDNVRTVTDEHEYVQDPADQVLAAESAKVIAAILNAAMTRLNLPDIQRDIIARRYGLPPHQEASAREIARTLGLQRDRVSRILNAFQAEMTRPGGALHAVIKDGNEADLRAVGLGWAFDALGPWPGERPAELNAALTDDIRLGEPDKVGVEAHTKAVGVMAWYLCDYHDRTFSGLYPDRRSAPMKRPCPSCQRPSGRVKLVET